MSRNGDRSTGVVERELLTESRSYRTGGCRARHDPYAPRRADRGCPGPRALRVRCRRRPGRTPGRRRRGARPVGSAHHLHPPALRAVPVQATAARSSASTSTWSTWSPRSSASRRRSSTRRSTASSPVPTSTPASATSPPPRMTITDERKQNIDFSDPYFDATQALLVKKDGPASPTSPQLAGKKLGVQNGTTGAGSTPRRTPRAPRSSPSRTCGLLLTAVQDRPGRRRDQRQRPAAGLREEEPGPRA